MAGTAHEVPNVLGVSGSTIEPGPKGDHVSTIKTKSSAVRSVLVIASLVTLSMTLGAGSVAAIVRKAAGIPEQAEGLEGFVNAANALITPALVAAAATAPLGCVVGAVGLMFGGRRGLVIIGSSLGTLVFLGSVKGIVA